MYKNVLIPLDRSVESEGVLDAAPDFVDSDGQATLLTVIPPGRTRAIGEFVLLGSQQEEEDRSRAMYYLTRIADRLSQSSVRATPAVVVHTSVADGIVTYADQQNVDLISMYTHDRKGLARLMKGSVAAEVERKASAAVRVYRPDSLTGQPVVDHVTVITNGAGASGPDYHDVDLFARLSQEQTSRIVALGRPMDIAAGEKLGEGGEAGQKLFIILDGEAHLTAHSDIGDIAVRVAGPGESFPLAVLLGEGTLITAGEALSQMRVLEIPRNSLLELCSQDAAIGMAIYAVTAQLFADRYSATLTHLAASAARELREQAD